MKIDLRATEEIFSKKTTMVSHYGKKITFKQHEWKQCITLNKKEYLIVGVEYPGASILSLTLRNRDFSNSIEPSLAKVLIVVKDSGALLSEYKIHEAFAEGAGFLEYLLQFLKKLNITEIHLFETEIITENQRDFIIPDHKPLSFPLPKT